MLPDPDDLLHGPADREAPKPLDGWSRPVSQETHDAVEQARLEREQRAQPLPLFDGIVDGGQGRSAEELLAEGRTALEAAAILVAATGLLALCSRVLA